MRYLPILDELFHSDSGIVLLLAMAAGLAWTGIRAGRPVRWGRLTLLCLAVYAACEILSNFRTTYLAELILLLVGTASLGGAVGVLLGAAVRKLRKAK